MPPSAIPYTFVYLPNSRLRYQVEWSTSKGETALRDGQLRALLIHMTMNTRGSFGRLLPILSLVLVTSRKISKVLFVAMDEVSFDYMDALAPGCTAMFPMTAAVSEDLQPHESCGNNVELSKSPIIGDTTAISSTCSAIVPSSMQSTMTCKD